MKRILLLSAVALLSSCGIYNRYQPVETVPDDLYGDAPMLTDDTASLGNADWHTVFTDPHLQGLIEQGLENNTDYRAAQLRIKEAEATLLSAKLAFLPSFALAPQGSVSSFDGQKANWTYQVPVTASWELDIFGRMRNAKKQAQALYAQSRDYRQAVRTQLIAGIANAYYTLLMLDEQLALSQQTAQAWEETVGTARILMKAGRYDESGVAQMEATCYEVQTSVLDLQEQINQAENSLALLLAETPRHYERGRLADQKLPDKLSAGIPLQLLANRPDVRSAQHSLEAAFYATNQARANFYPSITLSGSAGWTNEAGAALVNPGKFLASALAGLTQPLFNRGQNIANLKIAKAQQEAAQLNFEQALLDAGMEVSNALSQYQTAIQQAETCKKQVIELEKAVESTNALFQHDPNTTYLETLTAQQSLLEAQLNLISDKFDKVQAAISLYQALGGGRN